MTHPIHTCHRCLLASGPLKRGPATCPADGGSITAHARAGQCPLGRFTEAAPPPTALVPLHGPRPGKQPPTPPPGRRPYHAIWRDLHRRPVEAIDVRAESATLDRIDAELGCSPCRQHFRRARAAGLFDVASRFAYAAATLALHNSVNRERGKPEWDWSRAVLEYAWQDLE